MHNNVDNNLITRLGEEYMLNNVGYLILLTYSNCEFTCPLDNVFH